MARKKDTTPAECPVSTNLGRPLEQCAAELKSGIIEKLAEIGITDVEELLAVAAIEEVHVSLLEFLGVSKHELDATVKEVRKAIPESVANEVSVPDPYEYGLGALEVTPEMAAEGAMQAPPIFSPVGALPASVNLIGKMSPIRNQASRGTCVAFTVTAMHEYVYRVTNNQQKDFSEQHAYYETKLIDGATASCGTWQAKAAIALGNRGQCLESIWAYNPNPPCNNHGALPAGARPNGLNYRLQMTGLTGAAAKNVQWIKSALATKRPVGLSIPVYNSWYASSQVTKTGAINVRIGNEPSVGGHAICLVGYQDMPSAPGGGYFILRNHWSINWGWQCPYGAGYGTIPYQYITIDATEAFTPVSAIGEGTDEDDVHDDTTRPERTITIRVKGNVNLIIE